MSLACARCTRDYVTERDLTRHLIDEELIAPSVALEMVRKARNGGPAPFFAPDHSSPAGEESPHVKDVPSANLPTKEAAVVEVAGPERCQHCSRRKAEGRGPCVWHGGEKNSSKNAARDHRRRKGKPAPERTAPRATATSVGNTMATTGATFLRQLKELRARLDEKIAHVEDLIALL